MQIFQDNDAPRYRNGFTAHFCLYALFNIVLAIMRVLLTRRNMGKRKAAADVGTGGEPASGTKDLKGVAQGEEAISHANAFADLTDKENPDFRYEI